MLYCRSFIAHVNQIEAEDGHAKDTEDTLSGNLSSDRLSWHILCSFRNGHKSYTLVRHCRVQSSDEPKGGAFPINPRNDLLALSLPNRGNTPNTILHSYNVVGWRAQFSPEITNQYGILSNSSSLIADSVTSRWDDLTHLRMRFRVQHIASLGVQKYEADQHASLRYLKCAGDILPV